MNQYRIYTYDTKYDAANESWIENYYAVKEGFSWGGLLFGPLWLVISILKRGGLMVAIGRITIALFILTVITMILILIITFLLDSIGLSSYFESDVIRDLMRGSYNLAFALSVLLLSPIVLGFWGNKLIQLLCVANDFTYKSIVTASTESGAISVYKENILRNESKAR